MLILALQAGAYPAESAAGVLARGRLVVVITIGAYVALMLVIGLQAWCFSGRTLANYLLGGRRIRHWVAAFGAVASGRGSGWRSSSSAC